MMTECLKNTVINRNIVGHEHIYKLSCPRGAWWSDKIVSAMNTLMRDVAWACMERWNEWKGMSWDDLVILRGWRKLSLWKRCEIEGQRTGEVCQLWRWKDRVKHMSETGTGRGEGPEQTKVECLKRERWRLFCHGHPPGGSSQRGRHQRLQTERQN